MFARLLNSVNCPVHVWKPEDQGTTRTAPVIPSTTPPSTPPSPQTVSADAPVSYFNTWGTNVPTNETSNQHIRASEFPSSSTVSTPGPSDVTTDSEHKGASTMKQMHQVHSSHHRPKPCPSPSSPAPGEIDDCKKKSDADVLQDIFADILVEDEGPSSPFKKAYDWMRKDPHWKKYPIERLRQRFSLATLYYSTSGPRWKRSDQWLSYQVHECSWFPGSFTMSICGEDQHEPKKGKKNWQYERLWLPNNGLEGTLPPKLFQLIPSLRHVRLDRNIYLMGSLPSDMGLLTQISTFSLQHNMFSGSLPSEIGQLSSLEKLCLSENDLQGSIPQKIFGKLTNLRSLLLDHNRLTGHIPAGIVMAPLVSLNLAHNHFAAGGLPCDMLGTLTNLEHLVAPISMMPSSSSSSFSSGDLIIPTEIGLMSKLRHLDMYVSLSKWWSLSNHKWDRSEVATLHKLDSLRVGTEGNDDELIDLMIL